MGGKDAARDYTRITKTYNEAFIQHRIAKTSLLTTERNLVFFYLYVFRFDEDGVRIKKPGNTDEQSKQMVRRMKELFPREDFDHVVQMLNFSDDTVEGASSAKASPGVNLGETEANSVCLRCGLLHTINKS